MKKLFCAILILITAVNCLSACAPNKKSDSVYYANSFLIKDGKSDYKILIPDSATESEKFSAEEFKNIFYSSSGIELEILYESNNLPDKFLSIGDTKVFHNNNKTFPKGELGNGGFIIKTINENLYINSDVESGKIYGVLEFCEQNLGYKYYSHDEIHFEKITEKKLLKFDTICVPSFEGRNVFSYDTVFNHNNAVHLRLNSVVSSWEEKYGEASIWSSLHDMSNVFQLLNVKKYYNAHKDWFYLTPQYKDYDFNGMTNSECYAIIQKNSQLCYTQGYYNEDKGGMLDTYTNNLIEYIKNEPKTELFMLGMGDNSFMCDCEQCKKDIALYKNSGVMLRFVNKVAKRINEWIKKESGTPNRKIYLVTFAYLSVMEPPIKYENRLPVPLDTTVVCEKNVCVRIAPLVNANYYYEITDKDNNSFMYNNINGWKQITSNFAIWDYRVFYNDTVVQYPYWNTIKRNLDIYKDLNVIDVFHQGMAQSSGLPFSRLDDYVRSNLLYDINLDVNKLTDDFINNYYKESSGYIKEYLSFLRMCYETNIIPKGFKGGIYSKIADTQYWTLESLLTMENIFDKAYQSIQSLDEPNKKKIKERIDVESRFYRYMILELYHSSLTKSEIGKRIKEFEDANVFNPLQQHIVRQNIADKIYEWKSFTK